MDLTPSDRLELSVYEPTKRVAGPGFSPQLIF